MPLSSSRKTPDSPTLPAERYPEEDLCATAYWHKRLNQHTNSNEASLWGRFVECRNVELFVAVGG